MATIKPEPEVKEGDKKIVSVPVQDFLSAQVTGRQPAKAGDKGEDKKEKKEEKKPEPKTEKPLAKPPVRRQQPAAPPISEERIVEIAARTVQAVKGKTEPEKKAEPTAPELPRGLKRKVEVLKKMEELDGKAYAGITDKFLDAQKKLDEYAANWEKENPGEEFDEDDDRHKDILQKLNVSWEDEDFENAQEALHSDRIRTAVKSDLDKEYGGKISEFERKEKLREEAPLIEVEKLETAKSFYSQLGAEFEGILKEDGNFDDDKLKPLAESRPIAYEIVLKAGQRAEALAAETYKLFKGLSVYDPNNNAHAYISDFAYNKEQELLAKPEEQRLNREGKPFVTAAKYKKLSKEDRAEVWTFDHRDLALLFADDEADLAKKKIQQEEEKFEKYAVSRGYKAVKTPANKEEALIEDEILEEDETDGKPISPSTRSAPKLASARPAERKSEQTATDGFFARQVGG